MRLRPQGQSGPLCTRLASFQSYYALGGTAWTYELQALLKARVLAAPPELKKSIDAVLQETFTTKRDEAAIRADISAMRARMDKHFSERNPWSIKQVRGGLVDVEFILQAQAMIHAAEANIDLKDMPSAIQTCVQHGWLTEDEGTLLSEAHTLYTTVQSFKRLCLTGRFDAQALPPAFTSLLTKATETASLAALRDRLEDLQQQVKALFDKQLGGANTENTDDGIKPPPFD